MENASKALVIAGAILISIVLITLGVVILGQGQDVVNSSNMDATAISSWNSQFTQYVGTNVTGSNVNALMDSVVANNIISKRNNESNKYITIYAYQKDNPSKTGDIDVVSATPTVTINTKARSSSLYRVEVAYESGYISKIYISNM